MTIRNTDPVSWPVRAAVAAVLGFALMMPHFAFAAAAADETEELAEVEVTGTRIQVLGNTNSANPMTTITGEEMRQLGIVNVADALLQLVPQNVSTYSPYLTGDDQAEVGGTYGAMDRSSFFIGNTIANLRGLDPTFGTRTLTMVDGRRVVSTSNQADVVDMNIIPSNLLQRMDVVTGGASATYGSGAMAGVVNLVLNNRLTGFNLDMDYGINEAGDGGSPHISASGGLPLFGGRGHILLGAEWQDQAAIRDCAAARPWCAESRAMFNNTPNGTAPSSNVLGLLSAAPGYETYPARFQMANLHYSQFAPTGTIYHNSVNNTFGFRLSPDGTDIEEYAYGFRGGVGTGASVNGDGPLITSGTVMRPSSSRKTFFSNLEYNITERTTAYLQTNYAKTDGENKNRYTTGTYCVRFDQQGVAAVAGGQGAVGEVILYGPNLANLTNFYTGAPIPQTVRDARFNASFRAFLASTNTGATAPYFIPVTTATDFNANAQYFPAGATFAQDPAPNWTFGGNAVGNWVKVRSGAIVYWHLLSLQLINPYDNPGTPAVLPALGRNAYAYLNNLTPEALYQIQRSFSNSITTGGGASTGLDALWGTNACTGFTAMRKVWNPQLERWTEQESETVRAVAGVKGRFGRDWRWEAYYQYGQTESQSAQNNVATSLRLGMAMDAVVDDRVGSATFGQPVCRVTRDGTPILDSVGRPLSDPEALASLAAGCQPINIFGTTFATPQSAAMQQQAIDFAFVESVSSGENSLQTLSLSTNGTLWEGWGAGPMTGAFGLEVRKDTVDNAGTEGPYYLRADLSSSWSDAFGGSTTTTEAYTELNLPLISNIPGVNLWSLNGAVRYASYHNKGGAGTTGQSATQDTTNWKFSTVFEPFDWVRLRLTRSQDLRAAGYRDLFAQQPGIPDQFGRGAGDQPNLWRERTADSNENQREAYGQVGVGNPNLKPETSDTLTVGIVLSPGDWAQGMRLSVDYFDIRVKDGITIPFSAENPVVACWEGSGNVPAQYIEGDVDPANPGTNGLFDESLAACREIQFGVNEDGSRNLGDIVAYNSRRPANSLPFQRRGLDLSWSYMFPLARAFDTVPGSLSLTVRGQRSMESSGIQLAAFPSNVETYFDLVGQIRSSVFIPGVSASPRWTGNIISTYILGDLTTSLSARYIGGAKLDKVWCDSTDDPATCPNYQNSLGQFLNGSVDDNSVKPYVNFSLNGSYNLRIANMKQFQVFGSINNLFDKTPPFTGGGVSGASAQYHDTMGRAYRMGVRMKF